MTPPTTPELGRILAPMGSRFRGTLKMSRQGSMERFERKEDVEALDVEALKGGKASLRPPAPAENTVQTHGDGVFYDFDAVRNAGSVHRHWPDRPPTPFTYIAPPSADRFSLASADQTRHVLDYRSNDGKHVFRYHLDPDSGMMPVKVEYFDVEPSGSLFLFRFFTVEKYERTANGTYVPKESTLHDFATQGKDGSVDVGCEKRFSMQSFEENVAFPAEEFRFTFPHGARVDDNILGISYKVGDVRDETVLALKSGADVSAGSTPVAASPAGRAPVVPAAGQAASAAGNVAAAPLRAAPAAEASRTWRSPPILAILSLSAILLAVTAYVYVRYRGSSRRT
jgi:hypothetical protein